MRGFLISFYLDFSEWDLLGTYSDLSYLSLSFRMTGIFLLSGRFFSGFLLFSFTAEVKSTRNCITGFNLIFPEHMAV